MFNLFCFSAMRKTGSEVDKKSKIICFGFWLGGFVVCFVVVVLLFYCLFVCLFLF